MQQSTAHPDAWAITGEEWHASVFRALGFSEKGSQLMGAFRANAAEVEQLLKQSGGNHYLVEQLETERVVMALEEKYGCAEAMPA